MLTAAKLIQWPLPCLDNHSYEHLLPNDYLEIQDTRMESHHVVHSIFLTHLKTRESCAGVKIQKTLLSPSSSSSFCRWVAKWARLLPQLPSPRSRLEEVTTSSWQYVGDRLSIYLFRQRLNRLSRFMKERMSSQQPNKPRPEILLDRTKWQVPHRLQ
jgi:hypothetical protein